MATVKARVRAVLGDSSVLRAMNAATIVAAASTGNAAIAAIGHRSSNRAAIVATVVIAASARNAATSSIALA